MAKFEKLSAKEIKMLQELEEKRKRIEKHDKEFFSEVDDRKDEVMDHLGEVAEVAEPVSPKYDESKIDEILKSYDCSFEEFVDFVLDEKQIETFLDSKVNEESETSEEEENEIAIEPEPEKVEEQPKRNSWF